MRNFCLTICRFTLCAWVGGAILFVITSVHEQTFEGFGSEIKDQLALIRFPDYYVFGCIALVAGLVTGIIGLEGKRRIAFALLTVAALALMAVDYSTIYQPLAEAIDPPGQVRTQQFIALHTQSKQINQVGVSIALLAALIACWPCQPRPASLETQA